MSNSRHMPMPYFKITRQFEILEFSDEAEALFSFREGSSFLELTDSGSRTKAEKFLSGEGKKETELALRTRREPAATFKLSVKWADGTGHLVCIGQDRHMEELLSKISLQQRRLAETDLELLFSKRSTRTLIG
ncbi:hypothetical protein J9317_02920 [Metabacillus sp. KIGAM252]|uniref:Uncharacterized protein n=1 Tax=Metabacillus flavus TaxID=2823519 RepID=A0ABS5LAI4_9BACI|nr:hypothetical protein [Metabacillus flavus]MBS2967726.1 hypothetical protein [Metabacillus flavus]